MGDFLESLPVLVKYKVDFIIVGGVCAVLHGVPVTTFDLDIVHSRTSNNLERLMEALTELNAYYRGGPGKPLKPDVECIASSGHHLFMTDFGPLDVLGIIGKGHGYEDLINDVKILNFEKMDLKILNLERLIRIKEETGHEKDLFVIPILRNTLREKNNKT
ncbi:hypothetical protein QUF70_04240 [Desulfobacterales bacterium HSG17]|nr:hypothetical protein [Desulfobacterales bacterium HSG17]